MQVEALGRGVGRHQYAHRRPRIVERRLDLLAVEIVHAVRAARPEQGQYPIFGITLPQAPREVIERGLVLGEDDQPFVVAKPVRGAQQPLDQPDQGVEAGIRGRRLLHRRRAVEVEAEAGERRVDGANLGRRRGAEVLQPGAGDGGGGRGARLRFAVVAGLLAQRAGRGLQLAFAGRGRLRQSLPGAAPRLGERGGT